MHRNRLRLMQSSKVIYFPGLNAIRAFAALYVVIAHISNRLAFFNLKPLFKEDIAGFAVTIFFTLSGFLITYLLLVEKSITGTINIRKFYIRRVLRIWPLYYVYLLITIFVSGYLHLDWGILFYIFIIPNLRLCFEGVLNINVSSSNLLSMIGHYWSLGVEEQFYSFWPWLIKKFGKIFWVLICIPSIFVILKIIMRLLQVSPNILVFFNYTRFGCMAIGALGSYLYFFHCDKLYFLKKRPIEIITYLFFGLLIFNKFHITSIIDHEVISIFTLLLIYQQIANPNKFISLENKYFDFLGKISFGIYVYHPLVIYLLSLLLKDFLRDILFLKLMIIYSLVIFLTIVISYISYEYFEKRFLKHKLRFMTIESTSNKKDYHATK